MITNNQLNKKLTIKTAPKFFVLSEINNIQSHNEISLFPETTTSFDEIEKLAKGLYCYYEYLGFNGNPSGVLISEKITDLNPELSGLSFKILIAKEPVYLSSTQYIPSSNDQINSELKKLMPSNIEGKFPQVKATIYSSLKDFFIKNPIETCHPPCFQERLNFDDFNYSKSNFSSSMPVYDIFNDETYLVQAQGNNTNKNLKYEFGSVILKNETDAKKLAAALAQYYKVNGLSVGVIAQQIPNDSAFDMIVGKNMNNYNYYYNYYNNIDEFLSNNDGWDFRYLKNSDLSELGYYGEKFNNSNNENLSKTYYSPIVTDSYGKTKNLVSFTSEEQAKTYLTAYLSTLKNAEKHKSKIDHVEIFGEEKGMDLHSSLKGNITFSSVDNYIDFVESSKRHTPLDVSLSTYNKIVEYLKNNKLLKF